MLKAGFNRHYLVVILLLSVMYGKAQTAPSFTSMAPPASVTYSDSYTYLITTTDAENNLRSITSGALPNGLTLTDAGDGTATLNGNVLETGSFSITLTVTDPDGFNTQLINFSVAKATATVSLGNLSTIYNGSPQSATAITTPAGLAVDFTYNALSAAPINAGSYSVVATVNDTNYEGTASGTLVIGKATAMVTLSALGTTYNGSAQPATATTVPAGLTVTTTYDGVAAMPVNAGSYAVISTINEVNYDGNSSGTLIISKATPIISWNAPAAITYGTPLSATQLNASTTPAGTFTYNPVSGTVLSAGVTQTLSVNFAPTDATNYYSVNGAQTQITVNKASATVTLSNLTATYNGGTHPATATTVPAGLTVTTTYDGAAALPVNAGSYAVVATISDTNFQGNTSGTLVISKATPIITWNAPAAITYGTALSATQLNATTTSAGTFTYNPVSGTVLLAGTNQTLSVNFTPTDAANYNPVNGTQTQITVNKATATVALSGLTAIYDGSTHSATVTTTPAGLTVTTTYNGSAALPVNAGSYTVVSTINEANYQGNTSGTLVISKATPVISWIAPAAITYGTPLSATQLNASTTPAGTFTYNPVSGTVLSAGVNQTLSVNFAPTDATNYNSVNGAQTQITVNKASATVTLSNLTKTYNGGVQGAISTTVPAGLTVITTYNGSTTLPINAGSYTVVATISETNYQGNTSGTLVISKATPVITWNAPAAITYGTALSSTQLNASTTPVGTFTYNPVSGTVLSAGANQTLSVNFAPTDATNYNPVNGTQTQITVNKATATVSLSSLSYTYNGNPRTATVTTSPVGLTVNTTYDGSASAPVNTGSYAVTSTINNSNYQGNSSGALTINKATPIVTWATPAAITYGTPLSATQLNASSDVPGGTFSYAPNETTILNAGVNQLSVNYTPADVANYNAVNGVQRSITINKATPVITWSDPLPIRINVPLSSTQLNATSNVPGSFTYTPPNGTSFGTNGTYTLSANFTPTDALNYNSVSNTQVSLTVSDKDNPVINWAAPNAITYGTLLSAAQLNANANVPGTYTYTPAIGTLLNAGTNTNLKVDFVPSDAVNYNAINKTVQINVDSAVLTVTALNASRVYGSVNPAFSVSYSGFVNNETEAVLTTAPTVISQAIPSDNTGVSDIIVKDAVDDNYSFNYVNGSLTITKALLSAKPDDKSKFYGEVNPAFTIVYTGFVNGDPESVIDNEPTVTTTATQISPAGTYPITTTGGSDNNYDFAVTPGELTINKVTLTAKATTTSQTYGTIPVPTITYTGFVGTETASMLNTPPSAVTTATASSVIGDYTITISGGSDTNYDFVYIDGVLTINKAPLTATANNITRLFNTANPALTISYSGFVNNQTISVIDVLPQAATAANPSSPGGSYPIKVSAGADDLYAFIYVDGTLTVIVNNPPVLKNFSVSVNEDAHFDFTYELFNQNITDDAGSHIEFIKIMSLPVNGTLTWKGNKVAVGDEITTSNSALDNFTYQPNTDYSGTDLFNWNSSDGTFLSNNQATVSIKINAINDAPVLSNIESASIKYSLGDKGVAITQKLTVNDVDNNFIHSAKITIAENYSSGDNLAASLSISTKIIPSFNATTGELTLKGKDSKSNYEAALSGVAFSSAVTGAATVSNKIINIVVNDSTANSNIVSRTIEITEIFPELDIVNSFTPNNDGVNDQWDIVNLNLYSKIKISIVNQEGINVFSCAMQDCKWDGKSSGQELPSGAYFYTIDLNDGKRKYQGTVTILK